MRLSPTALADPHSHKPLKETAVRALDGTRALSGRPRYTVLLQKVAGVVREELLTIHIRYELMRLLLCPIPTGTGGRVRRLGLRAAGFRIGSGSIVLGVPKIAGTGDVYNRLLTGRSVIMNTGCHLDLASLIQGSWY